MPRRTHKETTRTPAGGEPKRLDFLERELARNWPAVRYWKEKEAARRLKPQQAARP